MIETQNVDLRIRCIGRNSFLGHVDRKSPSSVIGLLFSLQFNVFLVVTCVHIYFFFLRHVGTVQSRPMQINSAKCPNQPAKSGPMCVPYSEINMASHFVQNSVLTLADGSMAKEVTTSAKLRAKARQKAGGYSFKLVVHHRPVRSFPIEAV